MGVGSSSQDRSRRDQPPPSGSNPSHNYNQPAYPPPPTQQVGGPTYHPPYGYGNGGYYLPQGGYYQPYSQPNQYGQPPSSYPNAARAPTQEVHQTETIRNPVNLKKQTLKLVPTADPTVFAVQFRFDATSPCRISTFVAAKEGTACSITAALGAAPAVHYDKGLDQAFPPTSPGSREQHVVNVAYLTQGQLTKSTTDNYPLIVRLEALTEAGQREGKSLASLDVGCELPPWVQAQLTYARFVKEDEIWEVRVLRQKIWVNGRSFELQEIYGMENKATEDVADDLDGTDCVICMSEPRDTTVLPCRHMCMCHGCANALKTQTNKCPICRNEINSLLHIKINKAHESKSNS